MIMIWWGLVDLRDVQASVHVVSTRAVIVLGAGVVLLSGLACGVARRRGAGEAG